MPEDLFEDYKVDPIGMDFEVRRRCHVPEDCYYTVSIWPEHLAGRLFVDTRRPRTVRTNKISKSDQKE